MKVLLFALLAAISYAQTDSNRRRLSACSQEDECNGCSDEGECYWNGLNCENADTAMPCTPPPEDTGDDSDAGEAVNCDPEIFPPKSYDDLVEMGCGCITGPMDLDELGNYQGSNGCKKCDGYDCGECYEGYVLDEYGQCQAEDTGDDSDAGEAACSQEDECTGCTDEGECYWNGLNCEHADTAMPCTPPPEDTGDDSDAGEAAWENVGEGLCATTNGNYADEEYYKIYKEYDADTEINLAACQSICSDLGQDMCVALEWKQDFSGSVFCNVYTKAKVEVPAGFIASNLIPNLAQSGVVSVNTGLGTSCYVYKGVTSDASEEIDYVIMWRMQVETPSSFDNSKDDVVDAIATAFSVPKEKVKVEPVESGRRRLPAGAVTEVQATIQSTLEEAKNYAEMLEDYSSIDAIDDVLNPKGIYTNDYSGNIIRPAEKDSDAKYTTTFQITLWNCDEDKYNNDFAEKFPQWVAEGGSNSFPKESVSATYIETLGSPPNHEGKVEVVIEAENADQAFQNADTVNGDDFMTSVDIASGDTLQIVQNTVPSITQPIVESDESGEDEIIVGASSHGDPIIWTFNNECYDLSKDGFYLASGHPDWWHSVYVAVYNDFIREIQIRDESDDILLSVSNLNEVTGTWQYGFKHLIKQCNGFSWSECEFAYNQFHFDAQFFKYVVHIQFHDYLDPALQEGERGVHLDVFPLLYDAQKAKFNPLEFDGVYFKNPYPEELGYCPANSARRT